MALLFMDGFEAADAPLKWPLTYGGLTSTTTRFNTGRSWQVNNYTYYLSRNIPASTAVYFGAAIRVPAADSTQLLALGADNGTFVHLNIRITGTTTLALYSGNTLLGSYNHTSAFPGNWYYYELGGTVATSGGTATVRLDGTTVISFTGNTKTGGTSSNIDMVRVQGDNSGGKYVDDVYVCDGTGAAPHNTFLGDVKVTSLVPNAAGASTQFTPSTGANYTTVDELPYSATDYVSSGTSGQRDTYALTDLAATAGTVYGVQSNIIAKKTDAAPIALKPAVKSGASVYYGTTGNLSSNDSILIDTRMTNPATGAAWSITEVNSLEAGFEVA